MMVGTFRTRIVLAVGAAVTLGLTTVVAVPPLSAAGSTELAYGTSADGWAVGARLLTPLEVELRFGAVRGEVTSTPQATGLGGLVDWGFVGGAAFVTNAQAPQEPPFQAETLWPSGPFHTDKSLLAPANDAGFDAAGAALPVRGGPGQAISDSTEGPKTFNTGAVSNFVFGPEGTDLLQIGSAKSVNEVVGAPATNAPTGKVTVSLENIDLAGQVHFDAIITTVSAISNGVEPQAEASTKFVGGKLAGNDITLGPDGVNVAGQVIPFGDDLRAGLGALGEATSPIGITIEPLQTATAIDRAIGEAQAAAGGLKVVFHNDESQQTYTLTLGSAKASSVVQSFDLLDLPDLTKGGGDDFTAFETITDVTDVGATTFASSTSGDELDEAQVLGLTAENEGPTVAPSAGRSGPRVAADDAEAIAKVSLEMERIYLGLAALAGLAALSRVLWWRLTSPRASMAEEVTS